MGLMVRDKQSLGPHDTISSLSASDPPGAAIMWGRESPFVGLEGLSEERGRDCISLWHHPKQLDVSLWNAALPTSSFFFFSF